VVFTALLSILIASYLVNTLLNHLNQIAAPPIRVVVIGAGGFIGGAVAQRLRSLSVPVLALCRSDIDFLDPTASEKLAALLREGDAVLAASALAPCKNAAMLRDNMTMSAAIATALARAPVSHVVNVSSDAIYADLPTPLTEQSWTAPNSLHGAMHLARELIFKSEVVAPLAMLRPTLVYGAADPHNGYGPNQFRRKANGGNDITLFGEGEERRDHVLIDDVAELAVRLLMHRSTGELNAATGIITSFRDVADLAVRLSGRMVAVQGSPRKGPMPHNGYRGFDPAATHAAFPDFHYTPLAEGMAAAQTQEFR
jgi:nucleoside-diphosphate-sugar epimerase